MIIRFVLFFVLAVSFAFDAKAEVVQATDSVPIHFSIHQGQHETPA
jgi:hypothetical protein